MGGLTSLERVFTKLLRPNVYKYGKCLGKESENGIRVFEKFDKNGTRVLTSLKNGELYKTTEISDGNYINDWSKSTTNRHDIIVRNNETGNVFTSYHGTTRDYRGTRDEFRGTSLSKPHFGELEASQVQKSYRNNQLINEYNTTVSHDGTLYRSEQKTYTADNELSHVRTELRAFNYKMPNGQIVNYGRIKQCLPEVESYGRNKEINYLERTAREIELTPNGVNQFDPRWMPEYANNFFEKPVFLKG
jgi:hypothetical protein